MVTKNGWWVKLKEPTQNVLTGIGSPAANVPLPDKLYLAIDESETVRACDLRLPLEVWERMAEYCIARRKLTLQQLREKDRNRYNKRWRNHNKCGSPHLSSE